MKPLNDRVKKLGLIIDQVMQYWKIPGIAVCVIEDQKVIYEKCASLIPDVKINKYTLMKIGSCTKTMTSLLIGQLVEDGLLNWDTKVKDVLPKFALQDIELAQNITIKGLLKQGALMRYDLPLLLHDRPILEQLKQIPGVSKKNFFHYNNQLVILAGHLVASLAKKNLPPEKAFQVLMKEKIFDPLGMSRTCFTPTENIALPHGKNIDEECMRLSMNMEKKGYDPAGGVWSSIHDLSRYLIMEMKKGVSPNGKRIASKETVLLRHHAHQAIQGEDSYGMGYYVNGDGHDLCIYSDGLTHGFSSRLSFFPEHNCGFIILVNVAFPEVLDVISDNILQGWFGVKQPLLRALGNPYQFKDIDWGTWNGEYYSPECGALSIKDGMMKLGEFSTRIESLERDAIICCDPPFAGLIFAQFKDSLYVNECDHEYCFSRK